MHLKPRGSAPVDAWNVQLLLDQVAQLGVHDCQCIPHGVLLQELLQPWRPSGTGVREEGGHERPLSQQADVHAANPCY